METIEPLAAEAFCYVTTTGRRSGHPHKIEIWFGLSGPSIYLLSGGGERADWVRNMMANPGVSVRIGGRTFGGRARVVEDPREERMARDLLFEKYDAGYGGDLTNWRDNALLVAIDLELGN
jgi:deazaflavin-dependent oxidoreductase (nitroreductase family)